MSPAVYDFTSGIGSKVASPREWYEKSHFERYRRRVKLRQKAKTTYACFHPRKRNLLVEAKTASDPWQRLPGPLREVREAIEASRDLLQLEDNWDEEGGRRIDEDTWLRTVRFLTRYASWLWDASGRALDVPDIMPVPEGSIDLHWDYPKYELLINIPAQSDKPAGFYGDDRGKIVIEGHFDPQDFNEGLALWFKKSM